MGTSRMCYPSQNQDLSRDFAPGQPDRMRPEIGLTGSETQIGRGTPSRQNSNIQRQCLNPAKWILMLASKHHQINSQLRQNERQGRDSTRTGGRDSSHFTVTSEKDSRIFKSLFHAG